MSAIKELKEKMQRTSDKNERLRYSPIYKKKKKRKCMKKSKKEACMTKNKIKDKFDKK